jgi:hypothetical protein
LLRVPAGDDGGMVELPRRELAVPVRKSLPVWLPIIVAGAIAVGVGTGDGVHGARILLGVVGLVGLLLAAVSLLRPPTLVIDAEGMLLRTPLGERWRQSWSECGEFRSWQRNTVVWTSPTEAARHARSAAGWRKRADSDTGIVAHFGTLGAADLAALLNRYRSAAPAPGGSDPDSGGTRR